MLIVEPAHESRSHGRLLFSLSWIPSLHGDFAERDIVSGGGGMTSNCDNFIQTIRSTLNEFDSAVRLHNEKERARFRAH